MQKLFFSITVLFLASLCTTLANSADSSAFDPTKIAVTAKSSGGSVPVGTIIAWPVATNPSDADNWLECNGQYISSAVYPELYAVVGSYVPDYRGMFLRGYGSQSFTQINGTLTGSTATTHASGNLGAIQGDAIRNMTGKVTRAYCQNFCFVPNSSGTNVLSGEDTESEMVGTAGVLGGRSHYRSLIFDASRIVPTAEEIRPVNKAVRYLIRAKS